MSRLSSFVISLFSKTFFIAMTMAMGTLPFAHGVGVPEPPSPIVDASATPSTTSNITPSAPSPPAAEVPDEQVPSEASEEIPWDYSPYKVRIWIASNDERANVERISAPLLDYLDRPFAAAWRSTVGEAPAAVRSAVDRGFASINYEALASADPVLAVKRDHVDAPRIRFAADAAKYVKKCMSTSDRFAEVSRRGQANGNPTLDGIDKIMSIIDGDSLAVSAAWKDSSTEAVLLNRGMAAALTSPVAKLIRLPIDNLVTEEIQDHDKIFIVKVDCNAIPLRIEVVELDCLMRFFSPVVTSQSLDFASLPSVIGQAVIDAFGPLVRVEDAGQKTAIGLVRAAGLVTEEVSPILINSGEFLQPLIRKDDRNSNPLAIGTIPWCFLHVKKVEGARVDMNIYAGRAGGLQGRKNKRTFRMAIRTRPVGPSTTIRLHAQRAPDEALAGYEIYEKELEGIDMKLVGRTDWDGRLVVPKADSPMRLLYVKNGGAVLARLPLVPGLTSVEVADLLGDDQRLRAEAYIRGVRNAIIDLIAVRTLLAARIRLRLEKGQMPEAKDLLKSLQEQPTYDVIANDMGKKLVQIRGRNSIDQRKIDKMFADGREMLVNNINSKLLRELEADVALAEANNGVWKPKPKVGAEESSTSQPPAAAPASNAPASNAPVSNAPVSNAPATTPAAGAPP